MQFNLGFLTAGLLFIAMYAGAQHYGWLHVFPNGMTCVYAPSPR